MPNVPMPMKLKKGRYSVSMKKDRSVSEALENKIISPSVVANNQNLHELLHNQSSKMR